jgi:hypothetical protein
MYLRGCHDRGYRCDVWRPVSKNCKLAFPLSNDLFALL